MDVMISHPEPETIEARRARHLEMLREIEARGMRLAQLAEAEAARRIARDAEAPAALPDPREPTPDRSGRMALRFVQAARHLGRDVAHSIAMEQRIAAGLFLPQPMAAPAGSETTTDRRRHLVREALLLATEAGRKERSDPEMIREVAVQIEKALRDDPDETTPPELIVRAIAERLDLTINYANLPDPILIGLARAEADGRSRDPPDW